MYLLPPERAVGQAMSQLGLSLGAGLAAGVRGLFFVSLRLALGVLRRGLLSLAWIPVWARHLAGHPGYRSAPKQAKRRIPSICCATPSCGVDRRQHARHDSVQSMGKLGAPTYLVHVHHLTPPQAAHYTWIVPISGYFGALLGGAISWRLVLSGHTPVAARQRACLISALFLAGTMAVPLMPTPRARDTLGCRSVSSGWPAWSVNHYTLPIDIYGAGRAAFGGASLVFAYGVMQAIVSRPHGGSDRKLRVRGGLRHLRLAAFARLRAGAYLGPGMIPAPTPSLASHNVSHAATSIL